MEYRNTFIYNIVRRIWYRFKHEYTVNNYLNRRRYKSSFQSLKGIHKGERCFIIGNGPSLTANDLTLLKNEKTFAANRIFYIFDKTEWRPTYYCTQDLVVMKDISSHIEDVCGICKNLFLNSNGYDYFGASVKRHDNVLFFYPKYKNGHKKYLFSDDISNYVFDGGSITYAAIQIAVYMGFSEIYLIGVDHNYSSASFKDNKINSSDVARSYFEGMPSNIKMTKPNTEDSTLSFAIAKEYCDNHNIIIKNATRGGKLDVFQRVTLDEVLEKS